MTETDFFYYLVYGWIAIAAIVFIALMFITAPYGRHNRKGWGPQINATAGWIIMETPSPLLFLLLFLAGDRRGNVVAVAFLAMWLFHYIHRAYIYPFRRRAGDNKMPLAIAAMAVVFNLGNGYMQSRYINTLAGPYMLDWLYDPRFIIGAILFAAGFAINFHSDRTLFDLRKPGEKGYKIPRKGFFKWVSAPNYFGEILEWGGWAIATWSLPGLAFFLWTVANLAPRAFANHKWYLATFNDYPKNRKALIPFII